jgi:hypothetical protein
VQVLLLVDDGGKINDKVIEKQIEKMFFEQKKFHF